MRWLFVVLCAAACRDEDCAQVDLSTGDVQCDTVEVCEVNGGPEWYYRDLAGREYFCQSDFNDCVDLICDHCDDVTAYANAPCR